MPGQVSVQKMSSANQEIDNQAAAESTAMTSALSGWTLGGSLDDD